MGAHPTRRTALLFAALAACAGGSARAGDWSIFGGVEARVDDYRVAGDPGPSPYRFEDTFWRLRLDLNLAFDNGRGRTATVRADVLGADDAYLADDGFVVQQLAVEIEDGSTRVPYRLGLGDVFASFSRRTVQRGIRGASLELQPGGGDHSLLLVSGTGEPRWRDTFASSAADLYFNGASYLWSGRGGDATVVASLLHVRRGPDAPYPPPADRDQLVTSVAGEARLGGLRFEGELAHLSASGDSDTAAFAQLSRQGRRFAWRLRLEDTGGEFRPVGGVGLVADRRSGELHGRLRIGSSGQLALRAQRFEDGVDGALPQRDTTAFGLGYEGSPVASRPSLTLRASWDANDLESDDGFLDQRFDSWSLEVRDRFGSSFTFALSTRASDRDDRIAGAPDVTTVDHSVRLGRRFVVGTAGSPAVTVEGGMVYRDQDGSGDYASLSPTLDVGVTSDRHALELHLSFLEQDFGAMTTSDLQYHTRGLRYAFTRGPHTLAVEVNQLLRRPSGSERTDAARYSVSYRHGFGGR